MRYTRHWRRLALALALWLPAAAAAEPDTAGLLAAWEAQMRADERTRTFEPLEGRAYRFATERFPYAGRLEVTNLSIEQLPATGGPVSHLGVVEVALPDAPADFQRRHARSYAAFEQDNTLYYDARTAEWIDTDAFHARSSAAAGELLWGLGVAETVGWLAVLVALAAVLVLIERRTSRTARRAAADQERANDQARRAVAQQEEALKLLGEMRDLLKDQRGGRRDKDDRS